MNYVIIPVCILEKINYNLRMRGVVRESRIILVLMLAMLAIFAAILTASARAGADEPPHKLPADAKTYTEVEKLPFKLVKIHLAAVTEGQCTVDLPEQLETENAFSWTVEKETFFAVPCARWGDNQSWRIYVTSDNPEQGTLEHFKRMMFATLDWQGQFNATDVIHAWQWNENAKSLQSLFLYNGRSDCGSLYEYGWDEGRLSFKLNTVHMKSVCDGDLSKWPQVQLPTAPQLVK